MFAQIHLMKDPFSFPDAAVRPKKKMALELARLRQTIAGLQSRAAEALQTTDRLMEEQGEMHQKAVRIESDQGILKVVVKKEKKQFLKVEHMKVSTTAYYALISSLISAINPRWEKMSPLPAAIQKDQAAVDLNLKVVEKQNQAMLKQALVIQKNGGIIGQNLLVAAQKIEMIQQHADLIKGDLQVIAEQSEQMEEKKGELKQKVQELQQQGVDEEVMVDEEVISQEAATGFWSLLMQKIIAATSWFFRKIVASFVGVGAEINRWLAYSKIRTPADAINHPATWVILGAIACAAIKNTFFSVACIGLECSLFYYRWSKHNQLVPESVN